MPTLNQLQCSIELGPNNIKLKEYGTKYTDSVVETFVPVPHAKAQFSIHLEQLKYLAPGLAAFVFIDGVYFANRNRMGLKMPGEGVKKSHTAVDFRFRQKEEKHEDGDFVGRDWCFADLNIAKADKASPVNPQYVQNVGTIEIVILRAAGMKGQPPPPKSHVPSEAEHKKTSKPAAPVAAASVKKSAPPSAGGSFLGGFGGIFDGACDEPPMPEQHNSLPYHTGIAERATIMHELPAISSFDGANDEPVPHTTNAQGGRANAQPPPGHIYDPVLGKYITLQEAMTPGTVSTKHEALRLQAAMEYIVAEQAAGRDIPGLDRLLAMVTAKLPKRDADPVSIPAVWKDPDPNAKPPLGYITDPVTGKYVSLPAALEMDGVPPQHYVARQDAVAEYLSKMAAAGISIPSEMMDAVQEVYNRNQANAKDVPHAGNKNDGRLNAEHAQFDGAGQRTNYAAGRMDRPPALPRLDSLPDAFTVQDPDGDPLAIRPYQVWATIEETEMHMDDLTRTYLDIKNGKILRDRTDAEALAEMKRLSDEYGVAKAFVARVEPIRYQLEEYMSAHGITPDQLPRPGMRQIGSGVVGGGQKSSPRRFRSALDNFDPQLKPIAENDQNAYQAGHANQPTHDAWNRPDTQAANDWGNPGGNDRQSAQKNDWDNANNNSKPASQRSNKTPSNAWGDQNDGDNDAGGQWAQSGGAKKTQSAGGWDNPGNDKKEKSANAWADSANDKRQSSKHKSQISQSDGLVASSPPIGQPKPYWDSWQKAPPAPDNSSIRFVVKRPAVRSPYQYAAAKMPAVPENKISKDVNYGMQVGKGVKYSHKTFRPDYIDTMEKPFAVFSFKYRSIDVLKKLVKDDVVADMKKLTAKVEEADLRTLPRDELVARMMKMKASGGSKPDSGVARSSGTSKAASDRKSEKPIHRSEGWSEASKGKSTKGDDWKHQTSNNARTAWEKSQRSASNKGGDGGWGTSNQGGKSKASSAKGWNTAPQDNKNDNQANGWGDTPAAGVGWDGNNEQPAEAVKPPSNARDYSTKTPSNAVGFTQMQDGRWVKHSEAMRQLDEMEKQSRGWTDKQGGVKKVGDSLVSHGFNGNPDFVNSGGRGGFVGRGRGRGRGRGGGNVPRGATGPYQVQAEDNPMAKWQDGGKVSNNVNNW